MRVFGSERIVLLELRTRQQILLGKSQIIVMQSRLRNKEFADAREHLARRGREPLQWIDDNRGDPANVIEISITCIRDQQRYRQQRTQQQANEGGGTAFEEWRWTMFHSIAGFGFQVSRFKLDRYHTAKLT